ncbi:IS66 family transposase [Thorsellia anophelis]|uniref:IS66 family transposase n=1 Tax=Thorsellia anophelis TaxID=336804 RepID=UPI000B874232
MTDRFRWLCKVKRRKFTDIICPNTICDEAQYLIKQVTKLYRLEARLKFKTNQYRHMIRNSIARPIIEALEGWIDSTLEKILVESATKPCTKSVAKYQNVY